MQRHEHIEPFKYEIIICWSEDDDLYIAEVPELAGCMSDGESTSKALKNAAIVIKEWIEVAKELGSEIPIAKGNLAYA